MMATGMIRTSREEFSLYWSEHYRHHDHYLMRGTIRVDGFASLHAGYPGGTMTTVPLALEGNSLVVNLSTSAAGSFRVGLLDGEGTAIDGFSADDCDDIYGDDIERTVTWKGSPDITPARERVKRLELRLVDADLYSLWTAE